MDIYELYIYLASRPLYWDLIGKDKMCDATLTILSHFPLFAFLFSPLFSAFVALLH